MFVFSTSLNTAHIIRLFCSLISDLTVKLDLNKSLEGKLPKKSLDEFE